MHCHSYSGQHKGPIFGLFVFAQTSRSCSSSSRVRGEFKVAEVKFQGGLACIGKQSSLGLKDDRPAEAKRALGKAKEKKEEFFGEFQGA